MTDLNLEYENIKAYPVLYSFRRCPYAIRARMAMRYAGIEHEHREIALSDKPEEFLALSSDSTVPVLQLKQGTVLQESLDIMYWALSKRDVDGWAQRDNDALPHSQSLLKYNDMTFKQCIDKYKYPDRYPGINPLDYRLKGEAFLKKLEDLLSDSKYLFGDGYSLTDIAIFPFVKQFAHVDLEWFNTSPYRNVRQWLEMIEKSMLYRHSMYKFEIWQPNTMGEIITPV